jgi:hypothetical protein
MGSGIEEIDLSNAHLKGFKDNGLSHAHEAPLTREKDCM